MSGMRIHPRLYVVQQASNELAAKLNELEQTHSLTYGEMFSMLAERMANLAKYLIREERHPENPDKRGDEA